jgi:hypothetical protein
MKPRLIILSDLFGNRHFDWENFYINSLKSHYDVQYYDCCELGNIDKSIDTQKHLHQQFVDDGIEKAVGNLLALEKGIIDILAFSIGGTIAWKAGLKGLKINNLIAISATRLRYETDKPNCNIKLYFGEKDVFKPLRNWFERLGIDINILENEGHDCYILKKAAFVTIALP